MFQNHEHLNISRINTFNFNIYQRPLAVKNLTMQMQRVVVAPTHVTQHTLHNTSYVRGWVIIVSFIIILNEKSKTTFNNVILSPLLDAILTNLMITDVIMFNVPKVQAI